MGRRSSGLLGLVAAFALAGATAASAEPSGTSGDPPRVEAAHALTDEDVARDLAAHPEPPVELDRWRATSFGAYLAPKESYVADDGGFDVVFHFHAGQMAERQWRAAGLRAVIVSAAFGGMSAAYSDAFARPERFGEMLDEVARVIAKETAHPNAHVRRLALSSWSAGYASLARILARSTYYDRVDAVILLDSLHVAYAEPVPPGAAEHGRPFSHRIEVGALEPFLKLAKDASTRKKLMVVTHSSIIPPGYASTTEAEATLTAALGAERVETNVRVADGTVMRAHADQGDFHARGFFGGGPKDHFDHLYKVDGVLREFLVPFWRKRALAESRPALASTR